MALVLVYLRDAAAASHLRRSVELPAGSAAPLRTARAESWSELDRLAAAGADLAVVDPYADGEEGVARCAGFHARHPAVALLPYADFSGPRARDLLRLAGLGVREVALRGHDDAPAVLRARVDAVLFASAADAVARELGDAVPPALRPLLRRLVLEARAPLRPHDVARWEFCHPRTLQARLRAARLPSLNRLIVWARLFHAAHRLSRSGESAEAAALALGFPSATAFRMQVRRYAGVCASELAAPEGLARLAASFRQRLGSARDTHVPGALPIVPAE